MGDSSWFWLCWLNCVFLMIGFKDFYGFWFTAFLPVLLLWLIDSFLREFWLALLEAILALKPLNFWVEFSVCLSLAPDSLFGCSWYFLTVRVYGSVVSRISYIWSLSSYWTDSEISNFIIKSFSFFLYFFTSIQRSSINESLFFSSDSNFLVVF
jgi:hypothetical protein